jgi:heptose I phosphotransferase
MKETLWQRLVHGAVRHWHRLDWPRFAGGDWTERIMSVAVTDRLNAKQGRSTGRWILEADGRRLGVYLKRHCRLPWWHGLLATVWPEGGWSPAAREWHNLNWARAAGLPVPRPVAACEYIGPWGRLQSMLAVEELAGMINLHLAIPQAAAAQSPSAFARWKAGLTAEIARLTREIHQHHCFHKDFYLCHFFISAADILHMPSWRGRVQLIDLHRFGHHPWTSWWWRIKDLAQLLYSSEIPGVTVRDRVRFWKTYLAGTPVSWGGRFSRLAILARWRRYRRHNKGTQLLQLHTDRPARVA